MAEVVRNLAQVPEEDVRAIATYVASLDARSAEQRRKASESALARVGRGAERAASAKEAKESKESALAAGAAVYAEACAECHDRGRDGQGGALALPLATGLTMPTPRNLIYITRDGIVPAEGEHGPWMPSYRGALSERQLADLVIYLRSLTDQPPWTDVPGEVRKIAQADK
jgi:mono/diheme cytochrome c family protein